MADLRLCSIQHCGKRARGHNLCSAHYSRMRRHGSPTGGRKNAAAAGEPQRYLAEKVLTYHGAECLIWPHSRYGSGYAAIIIDGEQKTVSRMACEEAHGTPPSETHQAAHSCGRGHEGCVARSHLSWKLPDENERDKLQHGTDSRGAKNGNSKLREEDVIEIRRLKEFLHVRDIARRFNISEGYARQVQNRRTWAWLGQ